ARGVRRASAGERVSGEAVRVMGLAHVAIATREADALAATLASSLGATRGHEELLDGGALRGPFGHLGPVAVEVLGPRTAEHTVGKFLEARGPGLHHVSLEVADLEAALAQAREAGVRLIDEKPRAGSHGTSIAFLHPKSLGGVLLELCGPRKEPRR